MTTKIFLDPQADITCQHCVKQFMLRDALSHQLIERYENEYQTVLASERQALELRISKDLERKQARELEDKLAELNEQLTDSQSQVVSTKRQLEVVKIKAVEQARIESLEEAKLLQDELAAKDQKLAEFRENELALRLQQKKLEEQQADMALELERKLADERQAIEGQITRISNQMVNLCGELQGISAVSMPHLDGIASLELEHIS